MLQQGARVGRAVRVLIYCESSLSGFASPGECGSAPTAGQRSSAVATGTHVHGKAAGQGTWPCSAGEEVQESFFPTVYTTWFDSAKN